MSTLLVDELITELVQPFKLLKKTHALSFRAHLYVHDMPAGVFRLRLMKGSDQIFSRTFTSETLREEFGGSESYFHIYFTFFTQRKILDRGEYSLILDHTDYVYDANKFIGWCKDYRGVFGSFDTSQVSFTEYPYAYRIIERRAREL